MKEFFILIGMIIVVAVGAIYAYFAWNYPSASLRYEITVEVEADGRIYTGSSVHEVTLARQTTILDTPPSRSRFKGEAVAVDIADRGTLFMLLTGPRYRPNEPFSPEHGYRIDAEQLVGVVFDVWPSSAEAVRALPNRVIDSDVPFSHLPMMVRFDNINDAASVALVNPFDLAASFGEGVELRRVHVRTTQAEVTEGIEAYVPWFNDQHPRSSVSRRLILGNEVSSPDLPQSVIRPFKRGFAQ